MSFENKEIYFVLNDEESFELDVYIHRMSVAASRFLYKELFFLIYL